MENIGDLDLDFGDTEMFNNCEKCNGKVAVVNTVIRRWCTALPADVALKVTLLGRHYHPACVPRCGGCGRGINPNAQQTASSESTQKINTATTEILRQEKALKGLQSLQGRGAD